MEQTAIFEEKVTLSPKDMNIISSNKPIDKILLEYLGKKLENRCSKHGFVIPKTLEILSRSMGYIENGAYTGNIVFHVQLQGRVYNPVNGTRIIGEIIKGNKMGFYVMYKNSIRILIPRDLHLGNDEFEMLESGDTIEIEIRKSRFQIHDPFILSIGVYIQRVSKAELEENRNTNVSSVNVPVTEDEGAEADAEAEAEADEGEAGAEAEADAEADAEAEADEKDEEDDEKDDEEDDEAEEAEEAEEETV
jgi:DNA-directed RNA polymerase subunit E'/Rpb7